MDKLLTSLETRGWRGRIVSIKRLEDLREEIEGRHAKGQFDEDFYQERLTFQKFQPPEGLFKTASMIVVAVPVSQTQVRFTWNGKTLSLILPPTYVGYSVVRRQVEDFLFEVLAPQGYHVAPTLLPLKTLVVRSGLGEYGRNNISYVPGMGSFFEVAVVYSDLPCEKDAWHEPRRMEICAKCTACLRHCPTGAIGKDRFLLHAERCLVFHNERPSDRPFPAWIDPSAHHCLMGCMRCQQFCPEDKPFLDWIEGDEAFSHEETSLILQGVPRQGLPPAIVEKLERLELLDALDYLPRNLGVFFLSGDQKCP